MNGIFRNARKGDTVMGIIEDVSATIGIEQGAHSTTFIFTGRPAHGVSALDGADVAVRVSHAELPTLLEAVWRAYHDRRDHPAAAPYQGPDRRHPRR